jgi:pyruvate/2-oxoglutarate dehydrogenase complex dihydrolipoamide dehydrogenase (E3) component
VPIDAVDVIVLGMGVGGETLAKTVLDGGLQVLGIDERLVGGECAYWGCIPTKIMVRGSDLLAEARRAGVTTGSVEVRAEWARVRRRVRDATGNWDDTEAVKGFEDKGGRFVRGRARLTAPDVVEVNGSSFRANRAVVIACGTAPAVPAIPGLDAVPYWTNRDAVEADALPESIVVLGGGSVGVEFAQIWRRFGTNVTLVDTADRLLSHEEPEASALITDVLRAEGVVVHTGVKIDRVDTDDGAVVVRTGAGDAIRARQLMLAAGRTAGLRELGVGDAGLDADAKRIDVDERLRAATGIWAIGDVTGKGEFTHVATYQARIAAADILGNETEPARYHAVPRVTFSDPEVGSVGLTEGQAVEQGRKVRCTSVDLAKSSRGFLHGDGGCGLIKLVFDETTNQLIGATSIGPMGGEVLSMLTLAVHAELTIDVLKQMIYAYPTFHRAVLDALGQL